MILWVFELGLEIGDSISSVGLLFLGLFLKELILHLKFTDIIVESGIVLRELVVFETLGL